MKKHLFLTLLIAGCIANSLASPITGTTTLCIGAATTLSDATTGGIWSSGSTGIATVASSSGVVTGVSAGAAVITYIVGTDTATATVTVNPTPALSSSLTPPAICDSTIFNYTPMSSVAGTTFAWSRAFVTGIPLLSSTGTGNPDEQLINTTASPLTVAYVYTLSASGCTNTQDVTVTVNPTPTLSSTLTPPAICDTLFFNYTPTSATPGVTFAWDRPAVAGISAAPGFGTGSIHEMLHDSTTSPVVVTYIFVLSAGACASASAHSVTVTIDPCSPSLSANSLSATTETIRIYPNPTTGSFTIEIQGTKNKTTITISDITGRVIETRDIENSAGIKEVFNLDNLARGTYLIKTDADGEIYRKKVVVW